LIHTFLDAGILIAAVRGQEEEAARALAILEDPERRFVATDFLRMEVLPKAIYYQRPAEVALYERFFSKARLIPISAALITQAYTEAYTFGLSALDALHVTVAKAGGAEEFITTERTTTPLFRVTGIVIKPLPSLDE
jgi:predicted nucleic acid-binding protein